MKKSKRILAMSLALSTMFSLSSCSSDSDSGTGSSGGSGSGSSSGGGSTTSSQTISSDIWAKYEQPVTITTVTYQYPSVEFPDGDSMTENVWTRDYLENFNIVVDTEFVAVDADALLTRLNMSIAEGNLPDVFTVKAPTLKQLVDADLILDINPYLDEYGSDKVKSALSASPSSVDAGTMDGSLYGLPQMHNGDISRPWQIWLRQDWMDECGLNAPKTMDDLKEICLTFMDKYGGFGMATDNSLDFVKFLAPGWGGMMGTWIKDDSGNIVYGSVQPEIKETLTEMAEWFDEGIISPDFAIYDFAKMNEGVVSGTVGVQPFWQWWGYTPGSDVIGNLGADAIFTPYAIPSATVSDVVIPIPFGGEDYIVISKECENPEAAIKLVNYYCEVMHSEPGTWDDDFLYDHTENQLQNIVGPFRIMDPASEYDMFSEVNDAVASRDESLITSRGGVSKYQNSIEYLDNQTAAAVGDYLQMGAYQSAYAVSKEYLDSGNFYITELRGIVPDTLTKAGSTLDDLLKEGFTKIILGDEPVDYFDDLVESWEKAGGANATAEMNEIYG